MNDKDSIIFISSESEDEESGSDIDPMESQKELKILMTLNQEVIPISFAANLTLSLIRNLDQSMDQTLVS